MFSLQQSSEEFFLMKVMASGGRAGITNTAPTGNMTNNQCHKPHFPITFPFLSIMRLMVFALLIV